MDCKFCGLLDAVRPQDTCLQSAQGLACLADPQVDLFVEGPVVGDDAAVVIKLLYCRQLCLLYGDGGQASC